MCDFINGQERIGSETGVKVVSNARLRIVERRRQKRRIITEGSNVLSTAIMEREPEMGTVSPKMKLQ